MGGTYIVFKGNHSVTYTCRHGWSRVFSGHDVGEAILYAVE